MKFGIAEKVNLLFVFVIITFGLIVGWYIIQHEKHILNYELNKRISALLSNLSANSEYPVLIRNYEGISKLVKGILAQEDIIFCRIEDKDGKLLVQNGSEKKENIQEYSYSIVSEEKLEIEDDEALILGESKKVKEEIGRIYLVVSLESVSQKMNEVKRFAIIAGIITSIFVAFLSSLLLKVILGRPVGGLIMGIKKIAAGDLKYKVPVKTKDEIGLLATSFNKMSEDLSKIIVSKDYMDNIIESMLDTLIIITPDGLIERVNQAGLDLLGYKEEELIGKDVNLLFQEDIPFKGKKMERLIEEGHVTDYEISYRAKDGRKIPVLFSGGVMKDKHGNIINIVCVAKDITERKRAEVEAQRWAAHAALIYKVGHRVSSELELEALLSEIVAAVCDAFDYYSVMLMLLDEGAECLTMQSIAGGYSQVFPDDLRIKIGEGMIGYAAATGKVQVSGDVSKEPHYVKKAEEVTKSELAVAIKSGDKVIGVLDIQSDEFNAFDDTDVKAMETLSTQVAAAIENAKLYEQAQQEIADRKVIEKQLEDFAYIVSHDLRAPLRAVSQLAKWISQDYVHAFDEEGKEQMGLLTGRIKRMDNLIEGILEYSRIGRLKGEEEKVDLNIVTKEVIENLAPPENIKVIIMDKLPSVPGDRIRIEQVFQNLISNAIKFMDKPEGVIKIGHVDEGAHWKFSMADNGPGIDEKYYDKIFQVFQTLESRDKRESTGIGLSLVKKIIELHGGKVWVESRVGEGSTFFFTLNKRGCEAEE